MNNSSKTFMEFVVCDVRHPKDIRCKNKYDNFVSLYDNIYHWYRDFLESWQLATLQVRRYINRPDNIVHRWLWNFPQLSPAIKVTRHICDESARIARRRSQKSLIQWKAWHDTATASANRTVSVQRFGNKDNATLERREVKSSETRFAPYLIKASLPW